MTTSQLGGIGIGEDSIRRRVAAGGLHRLHRGVYAVGHPAVPFEGRCLAAVLALDPNATGTVPADTVPGAASGAAPAGTSARTAAPVAALSHRSAAELWGLMPRAKGPIHVTVATGAGRRQRKGLIVHRSRTLIPGHLAFRAGVRVTTPSRTLADLRPGLDTELHDRATRRALDLGLISRPDVKSDTALTRSELEKRFLALCCRHRIPAPLVNARVGPYEVDFLWPEHRVIVETDGFEHHGSREAFERDRAKDARLQARGYRVLRVTHRQLRDSPRQVAGSVRRLLGR